ncbi:GNAT family N-acetyltransferase [Pantoea sp. NSTU24]|uniref:GNAT family N-acetyltransferase n=1 Tax=Pantoea sp. NSTU24 TaxID=3391144 RepID=UPI003D054304
MNIHYAKVIPCSPGFEALKSQSMAEGFNMLRRLEENWLSGDNRFNRPGESLISAYADGLMVGVCGLNIDPFESETGIGRLRHFYISREWRNRRIGSGLLSEILRDADSWFYAINTNAPSSAFAFYERAGFILSDRDNVTHQFCLRNPA